MESETGRPERQHQHDDSDKWLLQTPFQSHMSPDHRWPTRDSGARNLLSTQSDSYLKDTFTRAR
jgi:hypothetical protein